MKILKIAKQNLSWVTNSNITANSTLLNADWTLPSVIENNDAPADRSTGYSIRIGSTAQGQISTTGDHDWFKVNLTQRQTYSFASIGTSSNGLEDPYLRLRNASGYSIAFDDNSGPANSAIITYTPQTSGTYYLGVSSTEKKLGQYGISMTLGAKPAFDVSMGAGALETFTSWADAPETGTTITYGFRETASNYTTDNPSTFSQVSATEMSAVRTVLSLWSDVCNIEFQEVNPGSYTDNATILVANYNDNTDGSSAWAMYPGSRANDSIDGDLWLNLGGGISTDSVPVGSYTFSTIIHELGHALGLSHPGDYNAEPGVSITYDNSSQFLQDSNQYSVMSYFDASATGGYAPVDDTGDVSTPLLFDVYQMQKKYGINLTTRTDNTTYGFGSTAGSVYDFTTNTAPLLCIWDAGGTDTLNCSGYSENATIVLIQGTFSSIGGLIDNVSIALNTVIENAVGGSGTNLIIGNNIDNILVGGSNNDTLKGGLGNDTMIGEAGNDTYYVDSLSDVVTEAANAGTETIITTLNIYSISALTNIENLSYTGTGNTALTGNASVNILTGRTGNDTLNGDLGNDTMIGGAGNDTYYVDSLSDVVTEASNAGNDTIITTLNTYSISALTNIENLSYTGIANAALTGNASVNILTGSSGNDTLKGGLGNDILTGGTGSDYFVFKTTPHNTRNLDTITDFVHGTDKIEFSKAVFSKITTVAGTGNSNVLAANEFVSNSSATHGTTATSHVIYNTTSGVVYYDTDGNGPGAAVKVAIIGTSIHQTLAATDFFITS